MEITSYNTVDLIQSNVCRCCLKAGCFETISEIYHDSEQEQVYGEMLRSTFDIQIPYRMMETVTHMICENCITRLQDATAFKQMVLGNEKEFLQIMQKLEKETVSATNLDEVEHTLEQMKYESPTGMEFGDESFGDDDDETLANLLKEPPEDAILDTVHENQYVSEGETRLNKCQMKTDTETLANLKKDPPEDAMLDIVHEKHYVSEGETRLNKCKMKLDTVTNTQKDWSKIVERRGISPILRENSLKLLANSTIFAFQWNKSRYRCFCCKEPFTDVAVLREHTNTKHTLKAIEKMIIDQQNRLVKVDISVLKCKLCDQTLQSLCKLREHLTDVHNFQFQLQEDLLVPFKIGVDLSCQLCAEKFSVFRLLNIHMNKHFQKQVCHICGAGFSNLVFLNLHKNRCHKPVKCCQCDMSFFTKIEKRHHENSMHNIKSVRKCRFPCPYCDERFFQEYARVQHLVDKHGLKKPDIKCNICSKAFLTKSLCNNHLKSVHMKEKSHQCEICHNYFYNRYDLLRHKLTHSGEKSFWCDLCTTGFASKDSVRRHLRRTHGVGVPSPRRLKAPHPRPDEVPCPVFVS